MELFRLDKLLGNMGYGTRKEVKKLVKDGVITIDTIIAVDPGMHVDPQNQEISINGMKINYRKYVYIMMNKPEGVISATEDKKDRTVIDLLSDEYLAFDLSPVGRLDKDTVGLLLLTNDGHLAHKLLSPKKHVPKLYYAKVQGNVGERDIEEFKKGVLLDDGYKTLPANLRIIEAGEVSEVEIEIFEGKYHQVKRMFEAVGKQVIFLMRMSMGPLMLDDSLIKGDFRELTIDELNSLIEYVK